MNKKAQFIQLFVVLLIVVLSALVYVMYKHNQYEETLKLNLEGATTFKVYGLAEKNKYYFEKAAEFSKQNVVQELDLNAGHLQGQCTTSLITNKILWNSCPKLNIEEDFKTLFKREFKKYIENQQQPMLLSEFETSLNAEEIKKLEPNPKILNKELITNFNPLTYSLDYKSTSKIYNSFSVKYIFNPVVITNAPDFSMYYQICSTLTNCGLNSQISDLQINTCIDSLNKINNLKVIKTGQIIDLNYENLDFSIDLKTNLNC